MTALIAGIATWEVVGWTADFAWLPAFSQVLFAAIDLIASGQILDNLMVSLTSLAAGYAFSAVVGVVVGTLMALYRTVEYLLDIYVSTMVMAPSIIFAPIFMSIFGLSDITRTGVIILFSLFIIIVNTQVGFRSVDPALMEMGHAFGANKRRLLMRVMIPAALPMAFAGLRIGMSRAVAGMVTGEMFITLIGLGALIQRYGAQFDATRVFGVLLIILAIALVLTQAIQYVDGRINRWAS